MCHNKVSAERPLPFIRYARARTSRTPVCVVLGRPFWKSAVSVPEGANRSVCQCYKQLACRVNQPASSWVALRAKRMLIFSLSDPFVEIRDCTPLYADSFDLNARCSQVLCRYAPPFSTLRIRSIGRPFQNLSDAHTRLPRMPIRASVDARSCICRTPVPVSMHTGVGWTLYYDVYCIQQKTMEGHLEKCDRKHVIATFVILI